MHIPHCYAMMFGKRLGQVVAEIHRMVMGNVCRFPYIFPDSEFVGQPFPDQSHLFVVGGGDSLAFYSKSPGKYIDAVFHTCPPPHGIKQPQPVQCRTKAAPVFAFLTITARRKSVKHTAGNFIKSSESIES